ncbi:aggregation-promoting factor C-terminal-like domain-containing protein [Actinacidiphila glaucinigra]|uniref:Transglycosylase SLT domain-containing protein n=1 Tax=Actinacidiphila glaucinigra TaxID=235986 RepID=A0A239GCM2_9ACTN|nr:transglycosylase SLT domain-containing protein [Actinacidiphila glaucinigra]SNS66213.1 Transglycosylase SLT domain-containing protein [Actinacidiphila glaucinigra]
MSRISVRGIAVASATAVTSVGAVVGVATSSQASVQPVAATDSTTVLADIPAGQQVQQASLTQQVKAQSDAADTGTRKAAEQAARKQAGKDATARMAAEAKAEADRKAEAAARAALVVKASYTVAEVQAMAQALIGDASQYQCFSNIVTHESGWNYTATNSSSGAYGLVQALPGSKMASAGADWRTNPGTQIKWGLKYMDSRYGSPCGAWSFWQANNWY